MSVVQLLENENKNVKEKNIYIFFSFSALVYVIETIKRKSSLPANDFADIRKYF